MSYLWLPALQIEVLLQQDKPYLMRWNEQFHQVLWLAQAWRVDVEWWRLRVWRDYYKLVTDSGLLIVIYHDLLLDKWFLQQVYD